MLNNLMADSKQPFKARLRAWQKEKGFTALKASKFLGVELTTYNHWLYDNSEPSTSPCFACIEEKLKE